MYQQLASPRALSLVALTVQSTLMAIIMRMSTDQSDYLATIAVTMDELIKLIFSIAMMAIYYYKNTHSGPAYATVDGAIPEAVEPDVQPKGFRGWLIFMEEEVFGSVSAFLAMGLPAVCYAILKLLSFYAIAFLSPAMFQLLHQFKLLTTAVFSYLMLGTHFTTMQKISLGLLCVGVALVELSSVDHRSNDETKHPHGAIKGSLAVLAATVLSGFCAVYIEKSIKQAGPSKQEPKPFTIWVRNIQLAVFGVIASMISAILSDKAAIDARGMFQGFTPLVWFVVLVSSLGGILTALVMKYADNILRNFATSVAIISTSLISAYWFGLSLSFLFVIGAGVVVGSIHLYSSGAAKPAPPKLPEKESFPLYETESSPMAGSESGRAAALSISPRHRGSSPRS